MGRRFQGDESDRPDAIFVDPFARRLAGERGQQIAHAIESARKNSWSFVARTARLNRLSPDMLAFAEYPADAFPVDPSRETSVFARRYSDATSLWNSRSDFSAQHYDVTLSHCLLSVARSFSTQVQHVRCAGPCQRDVEERVAIDIAQCEAVRGSFLIAEPDFGERVSASIVEKPE